MSIAANLAKIRQSISEIQATENNAAHEIQLIAVSKKQPVSAILEAALEQQRDFAESYISEAIPKIRALQNRDLTWHFIGRIQSNKASLIGRHFSWVHGLCQLKHAERLNNTCVDLHKILQVCIQVNIDGDAAKAGIDPDHCNEFVDAVVALPQLNFRGFMCIPHHDQDQKRTLNSYLHLRHLLEQQQQRGIQCDTLSMGLSGDYGCAIKAGATMVRIGTAIFGPRPE